MGQWPRDRIIHTYSWVAAGGAAACVVLLAVRMQGSISLAEPLHLQTSGDEVASLFAVWKAVYGQAVYTDRFHIPFSAAVYNWLFYEFYGTVTAAALRILDLGDAWLPTVARLVTLAGTVVGAAAAFWSFRVALPARQSSAAAIALAFAAFVVAGPLIGFWSITVRADVWAMTMEMVAVALFLLLYPRSRLAAVLAVAASAYLAWAFKQGSVFAAGGVGLFLLARRDWRSLAVLTVVLVAAWLITLRAGSQGYVATVFFSDYPLFFTVERGLRNLTNFAVKSGPSLLLLASVAVTVLASRPFRRAAWQSDPFVLALAGTACAAVITVPLSGQTGGAENYFFSFSFFLALLAVSVLGIAIEGPSRALVLVAAAGWVSIIVAVGAVLGGLTGVTDLRARHVHLAAHKRCLDTLPRPLFVYDRYLSLPWMTPGSQPFVLAYVYEVDRRMGRDFEGGGIGGMISDNRFAAVAVPGAGTLSEVDGGSLDGYAPAPQECDGLAVFLRRQKAGG